MVWSAWWSIPISILAALVAIWSILAVVLWLTSREKLDLMDMVRLLPDLARLMKGLATDPAVPRSARVALVLLLAFVASPIDLIPDFIPVIGFADDVVLIVLVLRWVTRRAGPAALTQHWPGTPEGLAAVRRVCGLTASS